LESVVGDILQPTHLLFILVIALLVLGPKRLPEVGRSLGRGLRDFREAMSGEGDHAGFMTESTVSARPAPVEPAAPITPAEPVPPAESPEPTEAPEPPPLAAAATAISEPTEHSE
jgi:sec-independent protein translocase protein TatA